MLNNSKKRIFLDLSLNYLALLLGGISGILINIIISSKFGPSGLGSFQLIYAIYIVVSQFSVCGIHQSVLRYLPLHAEDQSTCALIAWSALFLGGIIAFIFSAIFLLFTLSMSQIPTVFSLVEGLYYIGGAFIFFSCNKVMLLTLNALQRMRLLAFWQAIRFSLMIFFVYFLSINAEAVTSVASCFFLTELFLFVGLILTQLKLLPLIEKSFNFFWFYKHFFFGVKSLMNGVLFEFNSKVDILILGFFTDAKTIGLYSFAASLMEGILGLYTVIKNQISPYIVQYYSKNQIEIIRKTFNNVSFFTLILSFFILLGGALLYDWIIKDILGLIEFEESKNFFLILCFGLCFYAIIAPFDNILLLTGHPLQQSYYATITIASNVILNLLCIPFFQGYGAAWATALSFCLSSLWMLIVIKIKIPEIISNSIDNKEGCEL